MCGSGLDDERRVLSSVMMFGDDELAMGVVIRL